MRKENRSPVNNLISSHAGVFKNLIIQKLKYLLLFTPHDDRWDDFPAILLMLNNIPKDSQGLIMMNNPLFDLLILIYLV